MSESFLKIPLNSIYLHSDIEDDLFFKYVIKNPRCRKSRETLQLLHSKGLQPEIVEYLDQVPTPKEIRNLLEKLGLKAEDLVRKNEALYRSKFKDKDYSEAEWVNILSDHPRLIERPILVKDNRAALGRPPENVLRIL